MNKKIDYRLIKDFEKNYLNELLKIYSLIELKNKIINDLNDLKLKNNIQTLNSYKILYWTFRGWTLEQAQNKIEEKKKKRKKPKYSILNKLFWIEKGLSEKEAIEKVRIIQTKNSNKFLEKKKKNPNLYKYSSPMTTIFWMDKGLTKEEAEIKIKTQRKINKEYWINKGLSETDSMTEVIKFQTEQGKKRKKENINSTLKISYWLNKGFSEEEAKQKIIERQTTFSLEKCIQKYGQEEGTKKFNERQIKWQNTLNSKSPEEKERINKLKGITLENMIRKWGEIEGTEKYNNWRMNHTTHKFYSDISQELFYKLLENIKDKENVKFATHNNEKTFILNNKPYSYDFYYKNKIIEFNGDLWHANPKIYKETDCPNPYKKDITAKQIWEYDELKNNVILNKGYKLLIIWEKDYNENKENIINECLKFINNG